MRSTGCGSAAGASANGRAGTGRCRNGRGACPAHAPSRARCQKIGRTLRPARSDGPVEIEVLRSEEHTSELQSLMRISYAVFCLKKKKKYAYRTQTSEHIKIVYNN